MPKVEGAEDLSLSYERRANGRWLLRWRQWEEEPDGSRRRKQRTVTAHSVAERKQFELQIVEALRNVGWWSRNDDSRRPAKPFNVNLEAVARNWIGWKVGVKGVEPNTRTNLANAMKRFFTTLRALNDLHAKQVVPGSLMTTPQYTAVVGRWRERKYGDATIYGSAIAVLDMWTWAADQPGNEALPRPPYNIASLRPLPPNYQSPEDVATMAECDAVVRRIARRDAQVYAIIMRYTGLRLFQAAGIYREDIDWQAATMIVRCGKSRREKAQKRRIAISTHLIADLSPLVRVGPPGPLIADPSYVGPNGEAISVVNYRVVSKFVTRAWHAAIEAGEARFAVYKPPNRSQCRPNQAFRSAFQQYLEDDCDVPERVVDWLVGHAPRTTRGKHYARPSLAKQRNAVDQIPAIDWTGKQHDGAAGRG